MSSNVSFDGEKIFAIGKAIGQFLIDILWNIYLFIVFLFENIVLFLENLYIPLLPTRTRILREGIISGTLLTVFLLYVITVNVSAFNLFRKDKLLSQSEQQLDEEQARRYERISERRMIKRCFWGGAIGGFIGMRLCRHKTRKKKFTIWVPVMMSVQLLIYSMVIGFFGFWLCFS